VTPTQAARRAENLAFVFQELLTIGERLRSNRQQVPDTASFRAQIWAAVRQAEEGARGQAYPTEDLELAVFAVVAFLDESILNLADWPFQPLQEERYGHHAAGEIFFQNLEELMTRADSQELADLLEVYQLALLLGFAGRYSIAMQSDRGELRGITMRTGDRIQRIRQTGGGLAPEWQLPQEAPVATGGDSWVSRMAVILIACFVFLAVLFGVCVVLLNQGSNDLSRMAGA
jgi:type VI secretion system protein ImpK